MFLQKRKDRLLQCAETVVRVMVPQLYEEGEDCELPYRIEHTENGDHVVVDVLVNDKATTGQLIGRKGSTVSKIRRLLETVANQEGLRITFDIIPPGRH